MDEFSRNWSEPHLRVHPRVEHVTCPNEYLDSLEDYPDYPKIIEALISGESGSEIPSGTSSRTFAVMTHHPNHHILFDDYYLSHFMI